LEIYAVWHPQDVAGRAAADDLIDHYHGTSFSGLLGGAIEVYVRSEGWRSADDAPRSIRFPTSAAGSGPAPARYAAVVPMMGNHLATAVEDKASPWHQFLETILAAQAAVPTHVGIFPLSLDDGAMHGTELDRLFAKPQRLAAPSAGASPEPLTALRCRDLSQGITQLMLGADSRLTAFISHTMRTGPHEENIPALIALVRGIIAETRLQKFIDANDLQPGRDWDKELREKAASSAMLVVRTDLYAMREWCQREILTAKRHGMPIVILDCLGVGEERGSFLMDHVPRIPIRGVGDSWNKDDVRRGLNLLVDECLKRAIWNVQRSISSGRKELEVSWWAPHAPEPVTLAQWMQDSLASRTWKPGDQDLRVLHPDPPLGPEERAALQQLLELTGHAGRLDVMTPRMLAARGA